MTGAGPGTPGAAVADLEARLTARLDGDAAAWLAGARAAVAADPTALRVLVPPAARRTGRGPLVGDPPWGLGVDEAARVLLVAAAWPAAEGELAGLYRHGDSREKRAVLHALGLLPVAPDLARPLALDALRTNEPPLLAAALSARVVAALDEAELRQAVLKCVFVGLDVGRVPGLDERLTPATSRALAGFALERVAAGRPVPPEVWPLVDRHPPADLLAALETETDSAVPGRRAAAVAALADRARAGPEARPADAAVPAGPDQPPPADCHQPAGGARA